MATIADTHLARALRVTPNASQTRSKAPGNVGPTFGPGEATDFPLFAVRGKGAYVWDDHDRKYLDCFGANAAVPLGYAYLPVVTAVERALRDGSLLSLPHVLEAEVSEQLLATCAPWAHQVRWVKTGSEATHAALLIAQQATGRERYARVRGSYHGWHTEWREDASPELVHWRDLHEPLGNLACESLAAVFVEPPRWQPIHRDWLVELVDKARAAGAVVVFDEMVYGLRWAKGGGTEYYGVTPDLACFGKALGNGVPVACVCGPEHLMRHATACVSGTFGGDTLGLAAAGAVLREYSQRDVVGQLWVNGRAFWEGFCDVARIELEGTSVHWRLPLRDEALDRVLVAAATRGLLVHRASNNVSVAVGAWTWARAGQQLGEAYMEAQHG